MVSRFPNIVEDKRSRTHANGSKEEDEEEGEARRQEEDDEAPEEEISDAYRVRSLTGANRYGHSSFGVTDGEGKGRGLIRASSSR